jgi:hypothetical protein
MKKLMNVNFTALLNNAKKHKLLVFSLPVIALVSAFSLYTTSVYLLGTVAKAATPVCKSYNLKQWTTNSIENKAQNTYDPSCSSFKNWSSTLRPDIKTRAISGTTPIEIIQSNALAGAIASVKVGSKEYIASGGHGAAFQWNFHADPTLKVGTECYNPTEAGTEADDITNQWYSTYPIDKTRLWNVTPYHGPSTSAILAWPTTWNGNRVNTLTQKSTSITSRLAMYKPQGYTGVRCENTPADFPKRIPYNISGQSTDTRTLSPFILRKSVDMDVLGKGYENVFRVNADLTIEPDSFMAGRNRNNSVLIAYLQEEFTDMNYVDLKNRVVSKVVTSGESQEQNKFKAPILSTADGSYALGLYVPKALCDPNVTVQYYLEVANPTDPKKLSERRRTIQATFYETIANPELGARRRHSTYWVVGNRQYVADTLYKLYDKDNVSSLAKCG